MKRPRHVRDIARRLELEGLRLASVTSRGSGHLALHFDGLPRPVIVARTPSCNRAIHKACAYVRRAHRAATSAAWETS